MTQAEMRKMELEIASRLRTEEGVLIQAIGVLEGRYSRGSLFGMMGNPECREVAFRHPEALLRIQDDGGQTLALRLTLYQDSWEKLLALPDAILKDKGGCGISALDKLEALARTHGEGDLQGSIITMLATLRRLNP